MMTLDPAVKSFIERLRTVTEYADSEKISRVQAHRRIEGEKVDTILLRGRLYIVLPEKPAAGTLD